MSLHVTPAPSKSTLAEQRLEQGLTEKGFARTRKWAPRKKTGCFTCRARHVKCDEGKPACRRCIDGAHHCGGYGVVPTPPSAVSTVNETGLVTYQNPVPVSAQIQRRARPRGPRSVYIDLPAPGYDYLQAIQYYFTVVQPKERADFEEVDVAFYADKRNQSSFICWSTCHAITIASRSRGRLLQPGDDPAFAGVWATHSKYTLDVIGQINHVINNKPDSRELVLGRIADLLIFDVMLGNPSWRPHIRGFLAYLPVIGGFKRIIELGFAFKLRFLNILVAGVMANTTSPATHQISDFGDYSDDQLREIYATMVWGDVPCPEDIFFALHHVSRLRARAAARDLVASEMERAAHAHLDCMTDFDPDAWVVATKKKQREENSDEAEQVAPAIGRVYQAAALVYAVLTLPLRAVVSWPRRPDDGTHSDSPGLGTRERVRAVYRARLMAEVRRAFDTVENELTLVWPLVVLGVAVGGPGLEPEQTFVAGKMYGFFMHPNGLASSFLLLSKLRSYWARGDTEWEDCFDEPMLSAL